jgi:hypothetical protein
VLCREGLGHGRIKEWLRHKRPQDMNKKSVSKIGKRYLRKMRFGIRRKSKQSPALRRLNWLVG